ncbi:hypothetical protein MITS9509_01092 [Synechococcus sp. MIT S9509]|uniref:hypothetical protein n=1 Tax=unclassified Synechococcus TaxID=2626047 RepID=UPI0007BB8347|nr:MULTISPECIES: hypothetical protein [unclassified Synechococcus]KZR87241.1 hypothetical protein MITS9504_00657 [Synechococcus sp. MIT S9504]KZR92643.1 hypothetical protein MITS9509_01092 [Synechococcus sp. MIT S9509]
MYSKQFLASKLNEAFKEYQSLEHQYNQIQQELQMRQGALKTLQELVNKSAQEQVSSDTDSAPVTSIGSAAENVEMEDVA